MGWGRARCGGKGCVWACVCHYVSDLVATEANTWEPGLIDGMLLQGMCDLAMKSELTSAHPVSISRGSLTAGVIFSIV